MDNVTYLDCTKIDGNIETFAIIDRGNGEYISMPKADYDAQQANSTPSVSNPSNPQAGA